MTDLRRSTGVALWRQIDETLRRDIATGVYPAGARLPPEPELARRFSVNRHTVRRAIAALELNGLVRIEQGRGTFVGEDVVDYSVSRRTRFTDVIAADAREPGGRLLRALTLPAEHDVAEALGLREGRPVTMIERLGEADGRPICIGAHYFPAKRFPGIAGVFEATGSITRALARLGVGDYTRRLTRVRATMPTPDDARLLQQPVAQPILVTEAINAGADGRPIEYGIARFASARVRLLFET